MRVLFITLAVYIFDQVTKLAVKGFSLAFLDIRWEGMTYGQSIHLIGDWLKITFIENPNMAFGLEFGGKVLLSVFAILASIGIVIYLYRHRQAPAVMRLALALVLAGALGNLTDRLFYGLLYGYAPLFHGNVVDFMDFDLFTVTIGSGTFKFWPVFNVADSAVTVGVIAYLFGFKPKPKLSAIAVSDQGVLHQPGTEDVVPKPPSIPDEPAIPS